MKIVLLESLGLLQKELQEVITNFKERNIVFEQYDRSEDEYILSERINDADVLIVANLPLSKNVLQHAKNLKLISVAFTGIDHIDTNYCKENNIMICNAGEYAMHSVAELTMLLTLSIYRNMISADTATKTCRTRHGLVGIELFGKTVGIIGTGKIGSRTIELFQAFGCKINAYSRTSKKELVDKGVNYMSLEELLRNSDIISVHVPLTKETEFMIGKNELAMMKNNAIIINTARGNIIDQVALAEALLKKSIAGAGLDVFYKEPPLPEDHPILYAPNTITLPHVGFATFEALHKRALAAFTNIDNWLAGNPENVM